MTVEKYTYAERQMDMMKQDMEKQIELLQECLWQYWEDSPKDKKTFLKIIESAMKAESNGNNV